MRGFIRLCSAGFVVLGMVTMALAAAAGALVFVAGAASTETLGPIAGFSVGLVVVVCGFVAGASLTLIGGATFLLASIDERLELAGKKMAAPVSQRTIAPVGSSIAAPDLA
ncbi:MAG: hypothetical protein ACXWKY_14725 [Caulobacteraceae bacterium]